MKHIFLYKTTIQTLIRRSTLVLALLAFFTLKTHAQIAEIDITKADFLYNLTQFVTWNENAFSSTDAPFIICIIGENPFGQYLSELVTNQKVDGHNIVVEQFDDLGGVKPCHIIYINLQDADAVKEVVDTLNMQHTLTVANTYNFAKAGGMIRFYQQEGKLKIQINNYAAKAANLIISSKLLRLAEIYEPVTQ